MQGKNLCIILFAYVICIPAHALAKQSDVYQKGVALYQHGKGKPADFPEALACFIEAANQGNTRAQFFAGRIYHLGGDDLKDLQQAEKWYLKAAEGGEGDAMNNLGNVYGELGRDQAQVLDCFKRAGELGNFMGYLNFAESHRSGLWKIKKDYVTALQYYEKTLDLDPNNTVAKRQIGQVYDCGGFGVEVDRQKAEKIYLDLAENHKDADSCYYLYRMYQFGGVPAKHGSPLHFAELGAEYGNPFAALRAGKHYSNAWGVKRDWVKAAHFFELGARNNHGVCMHILAARDRKPELLAHYGEERTSEWKKMWNRHEDRAKKEVKQDLAKAREAFLKGDETAAQVMLDQALTRWESRTVDKYIEAHTVSIWKDAQIGEGRADREWARLLFAWQTRVYEARASMGNHVIGARNNLFTALEATGRIALLRESCEETIELLKAMEGIDVEHVLSNVQIKSDYSVAEAQDIPIHVDMGLIYRHRKVHFWVRPKRGDIIGGQAMSAIWRLSIERRMIGDWKSALIYAEWMRRWTQHIEEETVAVPRDYPGCFASIQQTSWEIKAATYDMLGLESHVIDSLEQIIALDYKRHPYGGRYYDCAKYQLAAIKVGQGRANEVDLADLQNTEDHIKDNIYENGGNWLFAKLARAKATAAKKTIPDGLKIAEEVLYSPEAVALPPVRFAALMTCAKLKLDAGQTSRVASELEEALTIARSRGLLYDELKATMLYVRYLRANGDYEQALQMQERVIALIDAMNLAPRRESEQNNLVAIQALRQQSAKVTTTDSLVDDSTVSTPPDASQTGSKDPVVLPEPSMYPLDVQPLATRTIPLSGSDTAEAVFVLTNAGTTSRKAVIRIADTHFKISTAQNANSVSIDCEIEANSQGPSTLSLDVPANSHTPIFVQASGLGSVEDDLTISFSTEGSDPKETLLNEWQIINDEDESTVSVVDAAGLKLSPFYLIPVYHHLSSSDAMGAFTQMRAIASEPTRIECTLQDGTLLFVDAEGNGSFRDAGDIIASERLVDLFPVLNTNDQNGVIIFRYWPVSACKSGKVEVRLETKTLQSGEEWETDSIDWIQP